METQAIVDKELNEANNLLESAKPLIGILQNVGVVSPILALGANLLLGLNKYLPQMSPAQRVKYEEIKGIKDKYSTIQVGAVGEAKIKYEAQKKSITKLTDRINSADDLSSIKSIERDINADSSLTATNKNTLLTLTHNEKQKIDKPAVSEPVSLTAFEIRPAILGGVAITLAIVVIIVLIVLSGK